MTVTVAAVNLKNLRFRISREGWPDVPTVSEELLAKYRSHDEVPLVLCNDLYLQVFFMQKSVCTVTKIIQIVFAHMLEF